MQGKVYQGKTSSSFTKKSMKVSFTGKSLPGRHYIRKNSKVSLPLYKVKVITKGKVPCWKMQPRGFPLWEVSSGEMSWVKVSSKEMSWVKVYSRERLLNGNGKGGGAFYGKFYSRKNLKTEILLHGKSSLDDFYSMEISKKVFSKEIIFLFDKWLAICQFDRWTDHNEPYKPGTFLNCLMLSFIIESLLQDKVLFQTESPADRSLGTGAQMSSLGESFKEKSPM